MLTPLTLIDRSKRAKEAAYGRRRAQVAQVAAVKKKELAITLRPFLK